MILIHLNNVPQTLQQPLSLQALLEAQNICQHSVALVLNEAVVPKHRWSSIQCQNEDKIDVFAVVAGG
ncbi:sulfur carrier protein ThiS [Shewanella bicestrii]|uniref:Sulfur carrier protein ThiS n=1 Tax=Shewanella seohaensis TaxID=755175 RepID=A0ABV4VWM7_9GAMM|nr:MULTISPECIES: sulfur carrier protein ThiS [Shewanella]ABI38958.1 thiamine biosynthesis protein ThiS [Shewanella sp. MR-4]MCL1122574.1 sulfur carrier protein ThiS [Shewanella seohaensis]UXM80900.1 sulfur carrier protein ThiS [Shewanella seohaensis]